MSKLKLLDQVRQLIRVKHYSLRTEEAYARWIKEYIFFHNKRHPADMGKQEVRQFLSHLAVNRNVAASTQNQALSALLFLYREVLQQPLDWIDDVEWAKRPSQLPAVFTREEVCAVLTQLDGCALTTGRVLFPSQTQGSKTKKIFHVKAVKTQPALGI